jgi:hypothetical protein
MVVAGRDNWAYTGVEIPDIDFMVFHASRTEDGHEGGGSRRRADGHFLRLAICWVAAVGNRPRTFA